MLPKTTIPLLLRKAEAQRATGRDQRVLDRWAEADPTLTVTIDGRTYFRRSRLEELAGCSLDRYLCER